MQGCSGILHCCGEQPWQGQCLQQGTEIAMRDSAASTVCSSGWCTWLETAADSVGTCWWRGFRDFAQSPPHLNRLKEESGTWVSGMTAVCLKNKHVLSACDQRILFRPHITLFTSAWLLIPALSLTLKLFGFIMCFDMIVKILTGWQSSRAWLYIQATVKRMCLEWFYASGYCPLFSP